MLLSIKSKVQNSWKGDLKKLSTSPWKEAEFWINKHNICDEMTHSCLFIVWLTVKIQQRCKSLTVIFQLPNFNFSSLKPLIHKSLSRFSEQTYVGIYSTSTTQITVQSIRNFLRVFNSPAYFSIKSHFN